MLRIPSTEGPSVCLCWAKSKPQGPKRVLVCVSVWEPAGIPSHAPLEDHPLAHHRKPYALEGWILEI